MNIHVGTDYHYCPDRDCNRKILSRADNMREHYKIHLRLPPSKRGNTSRTFEEFYGFIRGAFPKEVADKDIKRLEDWRKVGGHLKSENVPVGRRAGIQSR
jgi:hypothetical protein